MVNHHHQHQKMHFGAPQLEKVHFGAASASVDPTTLLFWPHLLQLPPQMAMTQKWDSVKFIFLVSSTFSSHICIYIYMLSTFLICSSGTIIWLLQVDCKEKQQNLLRNELIWHKPTLEFALGAPKFSLVNAATLYKRQQSIIWSSSQQYEIHKCILCWSFIAIINSVCIGNIGWTLWLVEVLDMTEIARGNFGPRVIALCAGWEHWPEIFVRFHNIYSSLKQLLRTLTSNICSLPQYLFVCETIVGVNDLEEMKVSRWPGIFVRFWNNCLKWSQWPGIFVHPVIFDRNTNRKTRNNVYWCWRTVAM